MRLHLFGRGAADVVTRVQAALGGEDAVNIIFNQRAKPLQHGKRQIGEVAFLRVGMAHGLGNDFVAVAERHAFFHQIIRQIGGGGEALQHGGAHIFGLHGDAAHHVGVNPQRVHQRVYRVKQRLFVFLVVFVIRQGLRFHQHQQAHQMPNHAPRFAAHQLGHIGIFFLRHDAGTRAEAVGDVNETETRRHPQNQLFG